LPPPSLHEHITCVAAPAIWLSPPGGQLTGGADGLYVADRRVLSRLVVIVDGAEPVPVGAALLGASEATFQATAGDVLVTRIRRVARDGGTEWIVLRNGGEAPVTATLEIAAAADLAPNARVRSGDGAPPHEVPLVDGVDHLTEDGYRVRLDGRTRAETSLRPDETFTTTITITVTPPPTSGFRPGPPATAAPWADAPLTVECRDEDLSRLVAQGIEDLGALLLADEGDVYCAGGSPWYVTLFGRDSLWTARLALPLGHELAAGTLRALARRQGTRSDPVTEEAPGKIPHELRPDDATNWLPPLYYGTVDATPLFIVTLAEAWHWGMPSDEVKALLPAAERALEWLGGFDGFVSYVGSPDTLSNQGWKDSPEGVQHTDGRLPHPPIALSEVQAYAYQAARLGADLLDAFGRPGADRWREWAAALGERFRSRFWVDGYPAIALDGNGTPVDGLASNLGHLLNTGLLTPQEEAQVASRLGELDSGYGLRTLTPRAAGFDPLSYHLGSVWPHDTVIAVLGLARSGHHELAAQLARGLVAAAPYFGYRLPELFGGQSSDDGPPVPYPTACRPQAWASAASPALVTALLGLDVNIPEGRIAISPLQSFGPLSVRNIRIGRDPLSVEVAEDGTITTTGGPSLT
jgi:glycogen debranching enzyme